MPPRAVLPSALSTCGPASAAPSLLPSHEVTSEPSPADLNLSINPLTPPGEPVIRCTISCISWPAFGPSPNRPATSSIALSIMVIFASPVGRMWTPGIRTCVFQSYCETAPSVVARGLAYRRGRMRADVRTLPAFAESSLCSRCCQGPPVRSEALDFHLLAADLVAHGLDVVAA